MAETYLRNEMHTYTEKITKLWKRKLEERIVANDPEGIDKIMKQVKVRTSSLERWFMKWNSSFKEVPKDERESKTNKPATDNPVSVEKNLTITNNKKKTSLKKNEGTTEVAVEKREKTNLRTNKRKRGDDKQCESEENQPQCKVIKHTDGQDAKTLHVTVVSIPPSIDVVNTNNTLQDLAEVVL